MHDGASLAVGGFGLVGIPQALIDAALEQDAAGPEGVSNNCGTSSVGLGVLLEAHRIRGMEAGTNGSPVTGVENTLRWKGFRVDTSPRTG
jgi:3-oxoacid CoA-transferase subunit A